MLTTSERTAANSVFKEIKTFVQTSNIVVWTQQMGHYSNISLAEHTWQFLFLQV
jgi:hypothetical protein